MPYEIRVVTVFSFVPRGKLQHFTMVFAVAFVVNRYSLSHTSQTICEEGPVFKKISNPWQTNTLIK